MKKSKPETITVNSPEFKAYKEKNKKGYKGKTRDKFFQEIADYCTEKGFVFTKEYVFRKASEGVKARKFRFDNALIVTTNSGRKVKVAVEYEGIFNSKKSRHTSVMGYSNDTRKYCLAALDGWLLLRYTAATVNYFKEDLQYLIERT